MRGKPVEGGVTVEVLAKQTPGFSGADLANLVNEAAILAARRNKKKIGMSEFEEAIDRVIAGPERKSGSYRRRKSVVTAYHEAGHAVAARSLTTTDPLHKVSIIARGMMGGYTRLLPIEDRYLLEHESVRSQLPGLALGGHVAEEIVFGEMTTGSENDIERATNMARRMVTEYGMEQAIGPWRWATSKSLVFLGREIGEQKNYSEKTAEAIDEEIRRLIDEGYQRAVEIITEHRDVLDRFAKALIQFETLDGDNLERVFRGVPPQSKEAPRRNPSAPPHRERPARTPDAPARTKTLAWRLA